MDLRLVVGCPFCGRAVPYSGRARDGSPALAECLFPRCDVYFDFAEADVYAATSGHPTARRGRVGRSPSVQTHTNRA